MLNSLKSKFHAIFIDTTFTSLAKVRKNIYQSIKIVAIKFHAYVNELDKILGKAKTPQSFILGTWIYFYFRSYQ
jgi:hypothetical protein